MSSLLTDDTIHRLAPDDKAVQTARDLVRKRTFSNLGTSADKTWLLGQCQGSAFYDVSVDLADATPVGRCSCPSRKLPCKHVLGLMLAYLDNPKAFKEQAPSAELAAKREKQAQRAQKQAETKDKPRQVNKAALAKKTAAQREGLDLLERLLFDLVAGGQWFEDTRLERLDRQTKQMSDAYLPGAMRMLRQLNVLAQEQRPDEDRNEQAADIFAQLWATVQKGRNYLDGKLAGDESQAEADAVIEEVLGRAWQLTDLRDQGYWRQDLHLFELAYERADDQARQERIETSHLLDLKDGGLYRAVAYRPFKGMDKIPGQPSFAQPLKISEAAVYPGVLNRRVRWDKGAEQPESLEPRHLQAAYALAQPSFDGAIAAYRQRLKNPLISELGAVVLLRCALIGRVGNQVVLEDAKGGRLTTPEPRAGEWNVANLVRGAGMLRAPAVLLRLELLPTPTRIVAQPLAALTPETHVRLGL